MGVENKGAVDEYLKDPDVKIRKLIALKDINYSNSAIEAMNKIVKHQYHHLKDIVDIDAAQNSLDEWIPVYNNDRPNRKGGYLLTPSEIYNGKSVDINDVKKRIRNARTERIKYNKSHSCGICEVIWMI